MFNNNKNDLKGFLSRKEILIKNYGINEDDYNFVKDKIIKYTEERKKQAADEALKKEREKTTKKPPDVKAKTKKPPDAGPKTIKSSPTDYIDLSSSKIDPPGPPPQKTDLFTDDKIPDDILNLLINEAIRIKKEEQSKDFVTKLIDELDKELRINYK